MKTYQELRDKKGAPDSGPKLRGASARGRYSEKETHRRTHTHTHTHTRRLSPRDTHKKLV